MTPTKLPVLKAVFKAAQASSAPNMEKVLFVCVQHLLHTSVDLLNTLIKLGAIAQNIFLIGKHYSTCDVVVQQLQESGIQLQKLTPLTKLGEYTQTFNRDVAVMWQHVQDHIYRHNIEVVVVLDDGGKCLEFVTPGILGELPIIGIEQTTAGLFNPAVLNLHVPFIDVAACAAKVHLESEFVVEAILNKLKETLPAQKRGLSCGVVGSGVIGTAVAKRLISLGCRVYLYEQNKIYRNQISEAINCDRLEDLIQQVDYVFGCTGRDITANITIPDLIQRDKVFISCTSEDKEFLSLLKWIQTASGDAEQFNPLENIKWQFENGASIHLMKGGFPINFDDSGESVPAHEIQLTRGLLLSALIQATTNLPDLIHANIKGRVMLHPQAQKFVVNEWFKANQNHPFSIQLTDNFDDIDWITINSGGLPCESHYMKTCFSDPLTI